MGAFASKAAAQKEIDQINNEQKKESEKTMSAISKLDRKTQVPHLLIKLRSLGFVEIQGKDVGSIYKKLDDWLVHTWDALPLDTDINLVAVDGTSCGCCGRWSLDVQVVPLEKHRRLCDSSYTLGKMDLSGVPRPSGVYKARGESGEDNMGRLTMQLVDFMTRECGWDFKVCSGSTLGRRGEFREQQMLFRAPRDLRTTAPSPPPAAPPAASPSAAAPFVLILLRQAGFVEVSGRDAGDVYHKLGQFFRKKWRAERAEVDREYCDLKFRAGSTFQRRGDDGDANNMGLRCVELTDFMVKECQWSLVSSTGGTFGPRGNQRERQLVFRKDPAPRCGADSVMVGLYASGSVEVNGVEHAEDLRAPLRNFLGKDWDLSESPPLFWEKERLCELRYAAPQHFYYQKGLANNLAKRAIELSEFMGRHGWALSHCNGGSVQPSPDEFPNSLNREQQLTFTRAPGLSEAPLLVVCLRTQPTSDSPIAWDSVVEASGHNVNGVHNKLMGFVKDHMSGARVAGKHCDAAYGCGQAFRMKRSSVDEASAWSRNGECNMGQWAMRLCDFVVDHLGEWELVSCSSDSVPWSFSHKSKGKDGGVRKWNSVTAREVQLVFRNNLGKAVTNFSPEIMRPLGRQPQNVPTYWEDQFTKLGKVGHKEFCGTDDELVWMQQLLDNTFKKQPVGSPFDVKPPADRLVVVKCLRSEHPELWDRFAERVKVVADNCNARRGTEDLVVPLTMTACEELAKRCQHPSNGNPANQAYLLLGTNPTSAIAMLRHAFHGNFVGWRQGSSLGQGFYVTESSNRADEYARDDVGGEYDGLFAILVCRATVGRSLEVSEAGDYREEVRQGGYDHVLGDRDGLGTVRDFVFFHEASLYPEYAIFYRREKDGSVLPGPKREAAEFAQRKLELRAAVVGRPEGSRHDDLGDVVGATASYASTSEST